MSCDTSDNTSQAEMTKAKHFLDAQHAFMQEYIETQEMTGDDYSAGHMNVQIWAITLLCTRPEHN